MKNSSVSRPEDYVFTIGIDWADQKHDVCIRSSEKGLIEMMQLDHTPEAISKWVAHLRDRAQGRRVAIGLEQTRGALLYALMNYEFIDLYPINPQGLANYRKAFHCSGAKDDPTDAIFIEELVRERRDQLRRWQPDDTQTRLLRLLCEKRRKAVHLRVRLSHTLKSLLKEYFPQALELVGETLYRKMACDFLTKWSTLSKLKKARAQTLRSFYYGHNSRNEPLIQKRLELIEQAVALTEDPAIVEVSEMTTQMLVGQLRGLQAAIENYEQRIAEVFARHPDQALFESFPGAGVILAPRLLVALGSDRDRWEDAASLQKCSGIAPVMERSGKSCWVRKRWACPKFQRQSFHEFANESIRFSIWAKACYEQQRAQGKKHHTAVRTLAFKWIRIIYRCWLTRTPYDENTYIRALQKRDSRMLQFVAQPYTGNLRETSV